MDYQGHREQIGRREITPGLFTTLKPGEAVRLADDLAGVTVPGGNLIPPEKLGPGLVEQIVSHGNVRVLWLDAKIALDLPLEDLRPLGSGSRLVTMHRCDKQGTCALQRHKITHLGFQHNWTVEARDRNIVRVLRDDGKAWTFTRNPIFNSIRTHWLDQPPNDEDAEALTAAETAFSK